MDRDELMASQDFAVANEQIAETMRLIDRREWWLWFSAISVMLLLGVGIASFALPALLSGLDSLYAFFLNHAVRGLFGLVLVFNIYVIYEQIQINHIRHEFAHNLYKMAVLDPVTNMFNRRYVMQRLGEEIARCQRYGSSLTVVAFDLDGFKQINDEYGHAVGDDILRIFGEELKRATRGSDVAARYGGDEFLAILPECNSEQLRYVFRRLNDNLGKATTSNIRIRYSAGWTDYLPGESLNDLLERADDMLYADKRTPREHFVSSTVAE
jgi:diguanylate cyclase (GGDEF)-like protein